jgi:archaellum component FlaF (FlaF/FlaG flagellin family)
MSEMTKAAIILAVALIAAAALYVYFSPYNRCVRSLTSSYVDEQKAHLECARRLGSSA